MTITITVTVERDLSKLPAFKYRAKLRRGQISFAGSLFGSVSRAKADVEALLDRPLRWTDAKPEDATPVRATAEIEV